MTPVEDLRVVVADPVPAVREFLRAIIERSWGWRVVCDTGDGLEAAMAARSTSADLLLVDAATDGLGPHEIRALLAYSGTLVVVLLERPEQHVRYAAPSVLKTVPAAALRDRLRALLETHWAQRSTTVANQQ